MAIGTSGGGLAFGAGSEKGGAFQDKGEGHFWDRSDRWMLISEDPGGVRVMPFSSDWDNIAERKWAHS